MPEFRELEDGDVWQGTNAELSTLKQKLEQLMSEYALDTNYNSISDT